jgi:hypothetical protein
MALTMAVYTTQRNWRDVVMLRQEETGPGKELGLKPQLAKAKHDFEEMKTAKDDFVTQAAAEKSALVEELSKTKTELDLATKARKSLEAGQAGSDKEKSDAIAGMKATETNAKDYQNERDKLRLELAQAQKDRDEHFKETVRKTEDYTQAVNKIEQLQKQLEDAAKELAKDKEALRYFDINPDSNYKSKAPPKVDGIVTGVLESGLIQISLGSDDGLRVGHQLQVYRINAGQSTYVGRVEIVRTDPSASVCKVDPKYQNSNVMVNDRVASKLE